MKHKLFVKIMVWILAILMIAGSVTIIFSSFLPTYAAEPASSDVVEAEEADYVTVGLMYGSDVTVGFETVSTVGFAVHSVTSTRTERSYEEIFTIDIPKVSVVCDDNLSQSAYTYSIYNTSKKCVIGGYHVEVEEDFDSREKAEAMLELVKEGLKDEGSDMHPFIAYIDGAYKIRIGDYSSVERIEQKIKSIPDLASTIDMTVAEPSDTCVMVVDPETNVIYFEYDGEGETSLGLTALPKNGEKQYLKTPAGRLYDGVFVYDRYKTDTVNGVALTNLLPLEDYIAGVVPYEISPDWPYEALRAFAITVRSYTVKNRNRHFTSYGFDICNTTHCQVYRGIANANDAVFSAVESTRGQVLSDGETVASTYYSSSMGGYTASSKDTWGGTDSLYLQPAYTPWERYSEHNKGLWLSEVSGAELADTLRSKGYTDIKGDIVDIVINAYSGDSPYVYSITYIDARGKEHTVTRCDKVRTTISKYVNSANFVVGKGTLTYSYDRVEKINMESPYSFTFGDYVSVPEERKVLTASGTYTNDTKRLYVQTADGVTRENAEVLSFANGASGVAFDLDSMPGVILRRVTVTHEAADENTFIFAGKGWGHGVGISQYGTLDLATAGATAEQILSLYFPMLHLCDYRRVGEEPADPVVETIEVPAETTVEPDAE